MGMCECADSEEIRLQTKRNACYAVRSTTSRLTRVGLCVERLGGEETSTAYLNTRTPSVAALFGVDVLSFDDDCDEWVGRVSTASDSKLARSRGGPGICFDITISITIF